ncbi:uncharacterized protein LOC116437077 isoform X3 [Corvus moneduloides]|uniref:uncharacterized protein LOC116437077 isoform X3 n=1 Tax=Corvus moneduloides TaxID=1196302 RepID=UPI0013646209|nr:uncharacterized protein LOC116437077 isoform X3 [Corvus moneduloides]
MESQAGLAWKGPPRSFTLCLLSGSTAKTIQNCHLTLTDSRNAFHSSCFAMGMAVGSSGRTREVPNPCEREAESPGSCEGNRIFLGNFEGLAPKGNRGNPGGAGKRCRSVSGIPGKWKAAEAARTELEAGSSRFLSVGLCCWKFEGDQSWSTCGFTCGAWERRWTRNSRDVPLAGVRSSGSTLLSASSLPSPRSPGAPGQEKPLNLPHLWDQELWCWSSQSQLGPPLSCPWCGSGTGSSSPLGWDELPRECSF